MKKLSQILAIMAIVLAPFAPSSAVLAAGTCEIGYTGPNSDNLCVSETIYECTIDNVNDVVLINDNEQTAISGDALVVENTQTGTSSTGSATNSNNVTFDVTIINNDEEREYCAVVATVPATPEEEEPTVTPTPVTPAETKPTVLPSTSADMTNGYVIAIAATLGVGAVVSYLVTMAVRRSQQ